LVVEELLGERLDSGESVLWLETGVLSDLVHESLVLSLLGVEASHSAELWDQVDELVVGVLLDNEERLVNITDLDVVVLEIVVKEGLVGVLDVVLWRLFDINGVDSVDSVVTVIGKDGAADDLLLEELLDVDSLASVSTSFSGLVEQFFHLVIYRVVSEDSTGEVDEHPDLKSIVDIKGGLVAGPNIERGFGNLMLEILRFLVELGVRTNFEEVESAEQVLDHDVQELDTLDGSTSTLLEVGEVDRVVEGNGEFEVGSLFSAGHSKCIRNLLEGIDGISRRVKFANLGFDLLGDRVDNGLSELSGVLWDGWGRLEVVKIDRHAIEIETKVIGLELDRVGLERLRKSGSARELVSGDTGLSFLLSRFHGDDIL